MSSASGEALKLIRWSWALEEELVGHHLVMEADNRRDVCNSLAKPLSARPENHTGRGNDQTHSIASFEAEVKGMWGALIIDF